MEANWSDFKACVDSRGSSIQWVVVGGNYWLKLIDNFFELECIIPSDRSVSTDTVDFEDNYKSKGNQPPNSLITTQFELNNKDLKLGRTIISLSGTTSGLTKVKVPGTPGSGDGRYVAGGYAIAQDYDPDDACVVYIEDTDRMICAMNGLATDGSADATIQAMGTLPGIGSVVNYPNIRSYVDDDLTSPAAPGWYFWPLAMGDGIPPAGECEVEPIGGYGFLPSGFYLVVGYSRATKTTGTCRINIYWGRVE